MAGGTVTVRVILPAPAPLVAVCQKCKSLLAFDQDDVRHGSCAARYRYAEIVCPVCPKNDDGSDATAMIEVLVTYHYWGDKDEKHYVGTLDEKRWR